MSGRAAVRAGGLARGRAGGRTGGRAGVRAGGRAGGWAGERADARAGGWIEYMREGAGYLPFKPMRRIWEMRGGGGRIFFWRCMHLRRCLRQG